MNSWSRYANKHLHTFKYDDNILLSFHPDGSVIVEVSIG